MIGDDIKEFSIEFDEKINSAMRFCFFVRGIELQEKQISKLETLVTKIEILKTKEITNENENSSNYLLSLECITYSVLHELKMYVALKNDNMGKAWDELVEAQMQAEFAIKAHEIAIPIKNRQKHLEDVEKGIFPNMLFCSPGFTTTTSKCSICNGIYGECDHIKGKPYMGVFCAEIIGKAAELHEISIVKNPANRHARVLNYKEGGNSFDVLTLRKLEDDYAE